MKTKSVLENSIFYGTIKKMFSSAVNLTTETVGRTKKYSVLFRNTRVIGITVISAILTNLFLIRIMRLTVKLEWIFYRCLIVVCFLPWIFHERVLGNEKNKNT